MSLKYAQSMIDSGGGICCCGEHLGVFVSAPENACRCPAGWTFVNVTTATAEIVQDAINNTKQGRSTWPDRVKDGTALGRPGTRGPFPA